MPENQSSLLARIRFEPELTLINDLIARFQLDPLIDQFEVQLGLNPVVQKIVASQMKLTPTLAPRLCSLLDQAVERTGFDEPVDLYVASDAECNAYAVHSQQEGSPHIASLSSALVERMTDTEIRFVLGHELGHVHYRHYRAGLIAGAIGKDAEGNSLMPLLLQRRIESWDRLAELSADRAGFLAAEGRMDAIVSAFFKLTAGLGPEHLKFDISAFLAQLEDLQSLGRRELVSRFSHPATPIRVRALQLYSEAGAGEATAEALDVVDREVGGIAALMDYEVTQPLEVQARDFLLAGGLLAAHADEEVSDGEYETLVDLLVPFSADPEGELAKIRSADEAREALATATEWLRENSGEERYYLFRQLATVVATSHTAWRAP